MGRGSCRKGLGFGGALAIVLLLAPGTQGQLGDLSCTASINGQSVDVDPDGSFSINVPASPGLLQVTVVCAGGADTYYGTSIFFPLTSGQQLDVGTLGLSTEPPPTVESISAVADDTLLSSIGATTQVRVTAEFSNDVTGEISLQEHGTTYVSGNAAIATVSIDGLVTVQDFGTVFITAANQGATSVERIDVVPTTVTTTVEGFIFDAEDFPVLGASVDTVPFVASATTDTFGFFTMTLDVAPDSTFVFKAQQTLGRMTSKGKTGELSILADQITDAGVIVLKPVPVGPLYPNARYGENGSGAGVVGDFDGDGDPDIATTDSEVGAGLRVFLNEGDAVFVEGPFTPNAVNSPSMAAADLDGDGDLDLLLASVAPADVAIAINDGTGVLAVAGSVALGSSARSVAAEDVDGDGDADIIAAHGNSVSVALNRGDGTFASPLAHAVGGTGSDLSVVDIDGDLDPDVVVGLSSSAEVVVLRNTGLGVFPAVETYAAGALVVSLDVADMDGGGGPDILVGGAFGADLYWLPNDGTGAFLAPNAVPLGVLAPHYVALGDLDNDGDADVGVNTGVIGAITFSALLNDGAGGFSDAGQHAVAYGSSLALPRGPILADLDDDADLDVYSMLTGWSPVSILIGKGDGGFVSSQSYDLVTTFGASGRSILEDLDGDGALDLIQANYSSGGVTVLPGHGDGSFGSAIEYAVAPLGPQWVDAADLDADGDLDLAVASGNPPGDVFVLLNDGFGGLSAATSVSSYDGPLAVEAGDLDGDGDQDLAVLNQPLLGPGSVEILLNNGKASFVTGIGVGASALALALGDLDGDFDLDIALAGAGGVTVLTNGGEADFTAWSTAPAGFAYALALGDLDGDGDIDALTGHVGDVGVLLNDGSGLLAVAQYYESGAQATDVLLADVDGDGDPDAAAARDSTFKMAVRVLLNDGDGTMTIASDFGVGSDYGPYAIAAGDLDGDGDLDLVATAHKYQGGDRVWVLLNQSVR